MPSGRIILNCSGFSPYSRWHSSGVAHGIPDGTWNPRSSMARSCPKSRLSPPCCDGPNSLLHSSGCSLQKREHSSRPRHPPGPLRSSNPLRSNPSPCGGEPLNSWSCIPPCSMNSRMRAASSSEMKPFSTANSKHSFWCAGSSQYVWHSRPLHPPGPVVFKNFRAFSASSCSMKPCSSANWRHTSEFAGSSQYVSHSRPRHPPGPPSVSIFRARSKSVADIRLCSAANAKHCSMLPSASQNAWHSSFVRHPPGPPNSSTMRIARSSSMSGSSMSTRGPGRGGSGG